MRIRVLIADPSPFCRRLMSDWVRADAELECVAATATPVETIAATAELQPDVLCLDIAAWGEQGLHCLSEIMLRNPVKILVLTSPTADGSTIAFESLSAGAIDFLAKPYASPSLRMVASRSRFLEKVRLVANAPLPGDRRLALPEARPFGAVERVVAIIGTAGGPKSLQAVFSPWPATDSATVFVLQSLPTGYGPALASRLNGVGALPVAEAVDGGAVNPGRAILVPTGCNFELLPTRHLRLQPSIRVTDPSADSFLEHLAKAYGSELVAIFVSGVGSDGLAGADKVRKQGGAVLVESEATTTVPDTIRRLKAAGLVDGEAEAALLPAASAAFVPTTKKRAG
ncbi:MAG: Chemotaxis response regulator protein-glutamate methylesterase [Fimbriimonadaceae bacterium]|nr:Chemotaxis response regulator protein-glutamate methylesterase [Fimbriimonadaceae bacterium]